MTQYLYAIAVGFDQTTLTNVQDIIPYAPKGKPIPPGSVQRITLDQNAQNNGTKIIEWSVGAMSWAYFLDLVEFIWGDFDTPSAAVTVDTRGRDENFHRGNAVAILPVEGKDYTRREFGNVEGLTITLRDFQELGSGFTTGFSIGFEA